MTEDRRTGDDASIPDDEAERILAAAAELDERRSHAVTVGELRAAALEAGISQQAFDAALRSVRGTEGVASSAATIPTVPTATTWKSRLRGLIGWSGGVGGFIGFSWGALIHFFPLAGDGLFLWPWLGGIGASLYLALRYRRGSRVTEFALATLFLWVYLFAGIIVTSGLNMGALGDMLALLGPTMVGCIMAGAAIVRSPGPIDKPSGDGNLAVDEPPSR